MKMAKEMPVQIFNFRVWICFILFLSAAAAPAAARQKFLYSLGGAGDAPNQKNIFVENFIQLDTFGKESGWQRDTVFDGEQIADKIAVSSFLGKKNIPDFTQKNFKNKLNQIISDLHQGKIRAGDQVLITMTTHGAPPDGTDSHKVVCIDGDCDMQAIAPVLRELEKAGVKTAVMDLSCYSGQSLKLASDKTCVITGANDDVSFGFANGALISHMKSGISLEQAFMEARRDPFAFSNLQISSPAGIETQKMMQTLAPDSDVEVGFNLPSRTAICSSKSAIENILQSSKDIQIKASDAMPEAQQFLEDSKNYDKLYRKAQKLADEINKIAAKAPFRDNPQMRILWMKQNEFNQLTKGDVFFQNFTTAFSKSPLKDAALKTQRSAHRLYDKLYRHYKSEKANPCATFIL